MNLPVTRNRRLLLTLALVLVTALTAVAAAQAEIVISHDAAGRPITFDVRAAGADVEWYAGLLRSAAHGNEISTVTIRIEPSEQVSADCGEGALACYERRLMIVPAGNDLETAHSLLHEYGHHLDTYWPVAGRRELNGTPVWWTARGIEAFLAQGTVAYDYSLGWSHSIAEIFAEDYAYIHLADSYGIPWLAPPDDALKSAVLAELGGAQQLPALPPAATTAPAQPLIVTRSGALAAGRQREFPFRLLGPGRHVTFSATVGRSGRAAARLRVDVVCDGKLVASKTATQRQRTATLDLHGLGPASCEGVLASTGTTTARYSLRLRLAVEAQQHEHAH
jgi:hypothetical protein